jgi:hypothetical protein
MMINNVTSSTSVALLVIFIFVFSSSEAIAAAIIDDAVAAAVGEASEASGSTTPEYNLRALRSNSNRDQSTRTLKGGKSAKDGKSAKGDKSAKGLKKSGKGTFSPTIFCKFKRKRKQ